MEISEQLGIVDEDTLLTHVNNLGLESLNNRKNNDHESEPVHIIDQHKSNLNHDENNNDRQGSVTSFDHLYVSEKKIENVGIGAMNTIDIYLCIEHDKSLNNNNNNKYQYQQDDDNDSNNNNNNNDESSLSSIERHNKYMFSNKMTKQFYFAPYTNKNKENKNKSNNWNIFEFNHIFASETSFLCDIFSNVIEPLIQSFKNGQSGCLALYSPDS